MDARQKASAQMRAGAREANQRKKSREAAIRLQVRKELEEESARIRAKAEAELATRSTTPLAAEVSRARTALHLLAAYRREEGLDDSSADGMLEGWDRVASIRPAAASTKVAVDEVGGPGHPVKERNEAAPAEQNAEAALTRPELSAGSENQGNRMQRGRGVELCEGDLAKLELLEALSEAKRSADKELKELAARRARRAADGRGAARGGAAGEARGEARGEASAGAHGGQRAGSVEAAPRSSLFHWSVGGEPPRADRPSAEPSEANQNDEPAPAAQAAWKWARGA